MGGGHDMYGGVKGFVSNLVHGGQGHGHAHGGHGYPPPGAGAYPPAHGYAPAAYPSHGYAPAAYPSHGAPHGKHTSQHTQRAWTCRHKQRKRVFLTRFCTCLRA
jgi:hypothetical protein